MDPQSYLERIGVSPSSVAAVDVHALRQLQAAHVSSVPFETLAVTGDRYGHFQKEPVAVELPDLYEKIVSQHRGGWCFELNGLYRWLLQELGFSTSSIAAQVAGDRASLIPANHQSVLVALDEPYISDVGLGIPSMREPIPLDGPIRRDVCGIDWRITDSDRPNATYEVQQRTSSSGAWDVRYRFDPIPREAAYFQATVDFLASAPESPFTGDAVITKPTDSGHVKLTPGRLERIENGEMLELPVNSKIEWVRTLAQEFSLQPSSSLR